jgi:2-C-methyl-D-erythritol 4-phosphate cytidylyltransferase
VKIVPGTYENIKITTPEDLKLAEIILKGREQSAGRKWV